MTTADKDRYYLKLWRTEIGERLPLHDITEDLLVSARARIAKRTSPTTANCAMGVLKTYLNWASNKALLRDACHRTIKRLKEPAGSRHQRDWWTAEEVERVLAVAAKDEHQPATTLLVAMGCLLGMRPEEIIMQRWEDLALDAVDPTTGQPRPVCHITPHDGWQPKDGEARDVPIPGRLLAILLAHRQASGYLLTPCRKEERTRRVHAVLSYRYDPRRLWNRLKKALVAEGIRPITIYGMRHTFASNLLIANVSDVKVSRWLGHSDTRMVHKHYGHLLSYDDDINAVHRGLATKGG